MKETELRAIGRAESGDIRCSFCDKGQREVGTIVTAKAAYICDECTTRGLAIVAEEAGDDPPEAPEPQNVQEARRREVGKLARRLSKENEEARRRELSNLARRLAEECWREQDLPKVIGHLAMTLANALEPECRPDLPRESKPR